MAEVRMRLVLMGKTGVGKSASGNTILGRKCFEEYNTMTSGTRRVHCATGRFEEYAVYVVDPPGLMDTETEGELGAERAAAEMFEALKLCGGEIDAFVLVINYAIRFTKEDRDTLEILKIIFGEHYFKHLIVVLTHGECFTFDMDNEGTSEKSFDTWCDEQAGPFRQLFTDCKRRFVLFNNRETDEVKMRAQRKRLIQLVKDVQRNNGKYIHETFYGAKELHDRFLECGKATDKLGEVRMNLLLIGTAGLGKSATGNTILGRKWFKEYNKTSAGTKDALCITGRFEDIVVSVVDTPGLMNAETIKEERVDMFTALFRCNDEFDAFILVINYAKRFTEEEMNTLEILKSLFGENYFNHLIVVLTHGDSFFSDMEHAGTPEKSFDTWCDEQTGSLGQLFTACNGRIVLFNNREKDDLQDIAQRRQLIQLVKEIQRNNGKYSHVTFEDAKEFRDRFILECGKETIEMNLLLMGKTGVGKSSTGNTILGRKCFKEYNKTTSGTKDVQCNTAPFEGYAVCVVDPPGLMDTNTIVEAGAERAGAEMFEALIWCGGEIDAFILVIRYDTRFTNEDKKTLEILKIIFGENYCKHLIVVLTRGDLFTADMEHEGTLEKSFDTWCDEQTGAFKQLITDCKGRLVLFNNREKDEVKMLAQRQQLIQLVKDVQRDNGKYTSEAFEDAKELREQFILEQKAPLLQKNIMAKLGILITIIERNKNTPHQRGLEYIKQGIEHLQNEISMADKSTGEFQPLMQNVEKLRENLNNTEELYRLAQELHAAQISEMERMAKVARATYTTLLAVGGPVLCEAATAIYDFVSKIHSNLRFKRTCTKIAEVTAKIARSKTNNRQL